jgi:hypothetical protein
MAERAIRRPDPRQEPSALAALAGICAGAARKGGPYRDRSVMWERGLRCSGLPDLVKRRGRRRSRPPAAIDARKPARRTDRDRLLCLRRPPAVVETGCRGESPGGAQDTQPIGVRDARHCVVVV